MKSILIKKEGKLFVGDPSGDLIEVHPDHVHDFELLACGEIDLLPTAEEIKKRFEEGIPIPRERYKTNKHCSACNDKTGIGCRSTNCKWVWFAYFVEDIPADETAENFRKMRESIEKDKDLARQIYHYKNELTRLQEENTLLKKAAEGLADIVKRGLMIGKDPSYWEAKAALSDYNKLIGKH